MQDGATPAFAASQNGLTQTLALLLANKADINATRIVQQFKIFKYLQIIDNELQDCNIALFSFDNINDLSMVHVSFVCRAVLPQRV
jgi:hypothetical protein